MRSYGFLNIHLVWTIGATHDATLFVLVGFFLHVASTAAAEIPADTALDASASGHVADSVGDGSADSAFHKFGTIAHESWRVVFGGIICGK